MQYLHSNFYSRMYWLTNGSRYATETATLFPQFFPPTAPSALEESDITDSGVTLDWSASTDNVAVTGYQIYQDNVLIATVDDLVLTYDVADLDPETEYVFYIKAVDGSGNISEPSNAVFVTTLEAA